MFEQPLPQTFQQLLSLLVVSVDWPTCCCACVWDTQPPCCQLLQPDASLLLPWQNTRRPRLVCRCNYACITPSFVCHSSAQDTLRQWAYSAACLQSSFAAGLDLSQRIHAKPSAPLRFWRP